MDGRADHCIPRAWTRVAGFLCSGAGAAQPARSAAQAPPPLIIARQRARARARTVPASSSGRSTGRMSMIFFTVLGSSPGSCGIWSKMAATDWTHTSCGADSGGGGGCRGGRGGRGAAAGVRGSAGRAGAL